MLRRGIESPSRFLASSALGSYFICKLPSCGVRRLNPRNRPVRAAGDFPEGHPRRPFAELLCRPGFAPPLPASRPGSDEDEDHAEARQHPPERKKPGGEIKTLRRWFRQDFLPYTSTKYRTICSFVSPANILRRTSSRSWAPSLLGQSCSNFPGHTGLMRAPATSENVVLAPGEAA